MAKIKTKTCSRCGHDKPVDCFSVDKTGRDGYRARCLDCDAIAKAERGEARVTRQRLAVLYRDAVAELAKAKPDHRQLPEFKSVLKSI